jgi:hypothetical protein
MSAIMVFEVFHGAKIITRDNLWLQLSSNKEISASTLDSAHEKFDVLTI